jgi:hypothetical protein
LAADGALVLKKEELQVNHAETRPALVVGSNATLDHTADLKAFALDVADRLRIDAVVSPFTDDEFPDVDMSAYSALALWDGWRDSASSAWLAGQAFLSDVPTITAADVYGRPRTDTCAWCGERDEDEPAPEPRWAGDCWTVAYCDMCASTAAYGPAPVGMFA